MPSEHFPDRAVPLGPSTTFLLLTGLFAVSILSALGSEAPAVIERPAADLGPTQVSVGMWVVDISNIDSAQQNFTAEIAVVLRWKDSRLAHAGNGVVRYPLEQVWHPRVVIVNETNSVTHKFPESVEAEHDGTVLYRQRYVGAFTQRSMVAQILSAQLSARTSMPRATYTGITIASSIRRATRSIIASSATSKTFVRPVAPYSQRSA